MADREYIGDSTFGDEEKREEEVAANKAAAEDTRKELRNQTAKRNNLSEEEEIDRFLYESYEDEKRTEYLVDGAILTCTMCTNEDVVAEGNVYKDFIKDKTEMDKEIHTKRFGSKVLRRLVVTENPTAEINELKYATVKDSINGTNIPYFGNCQREPDNERERYTFRSHTLQQRECGSCRYLMNLEKEWENYDIGQSFFDFPDDQYGDKPGITMTSFLFCKHGGFIYPVTSGQEILQYAYYFSAGLTIEDILLVKKFNIRKNEIVIFPEIEKYFEEYPELWNENVVFAFEGLGSYSGPPNSDRSQGQFGAIFVYYQNGEPIYMSRNCSTLADHASSKTTDEGIYNALYWKHQKVYAALQLRDYKNEGSGEIPTHHYDTGFEHKGESDTANGINLHAAAEELSESSTWSVGCLTVSETDYYQFGIAAGFVPEQNDGKAYNTMDEIKTLKPDSSTLYTHWGCVVVNRKYMDEKEQNVIGEDIK